MDNNVNIKFDHSDKSESSHGKTRPEFVATCMIHRDPAYFIWNVFLPLFAINAMALCGFSHDRKEVEARCVIRC